MEDAPDAPVFQHWATIVLTPGVSRAWNLPVSRESFIYLLHLVVAEADK
jgi:hypothetical protein